MSKKSVLFLDGIPDNGQVVIDQFRKTGEIIYQNLGSANVDDYVKDNDLFDCTSVIFDRQERQELAGGMIHAVFNQISEPDSNKITLEKADNFYKSAPPNIPFFNLPSNILKTTRDSIYQLLHDIDKLHVPKTVRIQPKSPDDIYDAIQKEGFEFPVIFRQAGDHGGKSTIRIDDETEQFYEFILDGRDYYLTQFVDYANKEGLYAKYRFIVVNGEVFFRHVIIGEEWMVHAKSNIETKQNNQLRASIAKNFFKEIKPKIQPIVTEIHKRLGLDYFGIDCNLDEEMNMLAFEINASMLLIVRNTKNQKSIFSNHVEKIRSAVIFLIADRMK